MERAALGEVGEVGGCKGPRGAVSWRLELTGLKDKMGSAPGLKRLNSTTCTAA